MSRWSWCLSFTMLLTLWPAQPAEAGEVEPAMLVIFDQVRNAPPEPLNKTGLEKVTLSLRNESSETITAWKISCLQSESDGNFGVGSLETDSFLELDEADARGPIQPGEVRQVTFPAKAWRPTHPYAAVHCGVTAVVLADASYSGVRSEVHRIFDARAEMLAEVQTAAEMVDQLLKTGTTSREQRQFRDLDLEETIRTAEAAAKSGGSTMQLQRIYQHLRDRADLIAEHLPDGWGLRPSKHESMAVAEESKR